MDYRTKINRIKSDYMSGMKTYDQAKKEVEVLLTDMNIKGAKIAKKFGKNYKKLTFGYVFR